MARAAAPTPPRAAISSPLLEESIDGATGILLNITGGRELGLFEVNDAAEIIHNAADSNANIIFGAVIDEAMGDEVRVTVIGTGFDHRPGVGGRRGGPHGAPRPRSADQRPPALHARDLRRRDRRSALPALTDPPLAWAGMPTAPPLLQRTPLYDRHLAAGGRLVEFAGWEMPVQYTGVTAEHLAVRNSCGVFDVSHMGEIETSGPQAAALLQRLLSNDVTAIALDEQTGEGGAQYSLLCRQDGGVLDDLITYRLGPSAT